MRWITDFLRRRREDREVAREIQAHLDEGTADLIDSGMPEDEARQKATREFGNVTLLRQDSREAWGWMWLETLSRDLRYGARMLHKNPGFTAVAATTLALGIAVNATMFSLISGWLLKKPTVADPDHAVVVVSTNQRTALERGRVPAADFIAWQNTNHLFDSLDAAEPFHDFNLSKTGEPERLEGMRVTANYFRTLGVSAFLGRTFLPGEDQPGRDRVAVLAHGLWQRRFASDPRVIGKTITLDGDTYVVIGVMPAAFRQPAFGCRIWTPLVLASADRGPQARDQRLYVLFGRLKSGVGMAPARAEMSALARRAEQAYPASEKGWGASVMTLQEFAIQEDNVRTALIFLMTAVGFVLVIACANIANLLLARAAQRRQEIAIRTSLGAGRLRLVRQLLVESLLIALIGGCAGLVGAYWGIDALRATLNFNEYIKTMAGDVMLDQRVLAFTCLLSMGSALLFGLAPAIRVSAGNPQAILRQGGRSGDLSRGWGRNVLVGCQIALAMLLVTGAGLIIKATAEEMGGDFGFDPRRVLTAGVSLTSPRYREPNRQMAFYQGVLERLHGLPVVEAAAIASGVPYNGNKHTFAIQGQPPLPAADRPSARYFAVSPGYFSVFEIPLVQGRAFRDADNAQASPVAIVNRAFAERYFHDRNPLGSYIQVGRDGPGDPPWSRIVGIAGNIKAFFGPKDEDAQIYQPYQQVPPDPEMEIAVRAAGDANVLAPAVRSAVWSVDPEQPVGRALTISGLVHENEGGDYVFDTLLGIFGAMALLLAAVGIYGVVAYQVAQRTHEIGIRMALGAQRAEVLRSVIGKGMLLALLSAAIGLAVAAPLPKLFAATMQGFRVHSTSIFLCVPLLLVGVVLVAIYIPASRAARIDPMEALRYE